MKTILLAAGLVLPAVVPASVFQQASRHPVHTTRPRGVGLGRAAALLGFWIALAAMTVPPSPARAGESVWTHNGSTIRWVSSGDDRWLYYLEPRPGLAAMVKPDTLLFRGQKIGNTLVGTAYVFSENCAPTPYSVEGIIYSETDVTLQGAVPVVHPYSCDVLHYTWESHNASLRFRYVMTIGRAPVIARGRSCTVDDPTGTPMNVRGSPNGRILGALYNGTSVEVRDVTVDRSGRPWAYIAPVTEGKHGWVFRAYLDCE